MRTGKIYIILIILLVYIGLLYKYINYAPRRNYCDFRVYYAAGQQFALKQNIYKQFNASITPFKYSPIFAMLMLPLSLFSKNAAALIFFSINYILLIAVFILSAKLIIKQTLSFKQNIFLYTMPLVCTARFINLVLYAGQVTIIIFSLVLFGLYFLDKKKDVLAASCIGLSSMFKYMPLIFLPYFMFRKRIKPVVFILLAIVLYCLIPLAYSGIKSYINYSKDWLYYAIMPSVDINSLYDFKNQSIFSMILRYFTANLPYPPYTQIKIYITSLSFYQGVFLASVAALIIYLFVMFGRRAHSTDDALDYSMLFICMAIFNPNAWPANFIFCLFAYMAVCYYLLRVNFRDKIILLLAVFSFVAMNAGSEFLVGDKLENLTEQLSLVTIGALALVFILFKLKFRKTS